MFCAARLQRNAQQIKQLVHATFVHNLKHVSNSKPVDQIWTFGNILSGPK